MERIGFGDQPYLVYKHTDAAHSHVHIATTNIMADGQRIDTHNIGKTLSETARKKLEQEFGLIKAEGRALSNALGIKPADIAKAEYGKVPTKRTITNIVNAVIRSYKFTSFAEMNAVLRQFNVTANRGNENTTMYQKNGLLYTMVNQQAEHIGVPIKASAIYGKPTLANLEKAFLQNAERRKPYREPLKTAIENVFKAYTSITKATFIAELDKLNINVVFRQNEQGYTYGLTFIDNRNKTVFNGSDLGKAYSAKAISERLSVIDKPLKPEQKTYLKPLAPTNYLKRNETRTYLKTPEPGNILKGMLDKQAGDFGGGMPRKKKRKKKGQEPEQQQSL